MECGCGRSPIGRCIGWHTLSGEEYQEKLEEYKQRQKKKTIEMKISYHGPIADTSIIRDARAKIFDINAGLRDSDIGLETIVVTPNPADVIGLDDSTFGFSTAILDSAS